ncbi:hypothetical protein A1O3_05192 [Capronia epimyces CBS 606.96]|uniref:Uncharacterized protein n=1 Tax=Capronia epimyces CBS 606.96 TaxID=1182542 RepID=W9XWC2_9EURO|nr:uncharacterized protein A1O3_05192 [Capronia epimyces CBS 606.96]EXJ84523.1 hypothetical protein A1O3_05192 [Capronia epimyces CBS 606.96]
MARPISSRSSYSPPGNDRRRNYSTPLPFEYAQHTPTAAPSKPHPVKDDESHCYFPPSRSVPLESRGHTQQQWLQPKEQARVRQEDLKVQGSVQGTRLTTSPPETVSKDGPVPDQTNQALALRFSRPSPRSCGPVLSGSTESSLGRVFRDGVMHQMKLDGGVAYEHVDGVSMDGHPASSTSAYGSNEPIPEIEARDINEISRQPEHDYAVYDNTDANKQSEIKSPGSSISDNDKYPSRHSSGTSNSTSGTSISGINADHGDDNMIISPFRGECKDCGDTIHPSTGSDVPPNEVAFPYAHVEDTRHIGSGLGRKIELGVITEEDGELPFNSDNLGATPFPMVHRATDADSQTGEHSLPLGAEAAQQDGTDPSSQATPASADQFSPRNPVAPGIGDDQHIYELEASSLTRDNSDLSSRSRDGTVDASVTDSASSESSGTGRRGFLGEIHRGISTAVQVQAVEARVKKSVTFSPVEDVRFLTPSPSRPGGSGSVRHEANKIPRNRAR